MIPAVQNSNGRHLVAALPGHRLSPVFDRLFEDFLAPASQSWTGFPSSLWEDEGAIHFEMDLPGIHEADLEITVHEDHLVVKGERKAPAEKHQNDQRVYGQFEQRVKLIAAVDLAQIEASLHQGVLHVKLPKSQAAKPFRVTLQSTGNCQSQMGMVNQDLTSGNQ
ncbi:heat shock protein Hsp20 [Planctopirus limnophila DSM 3776]|uniref:Heat shock protein Hsp20 n=1 Tax=Planctopirus limnophila (strain ATCC 43296 / DSM 3776 / IFAM 1008 / Mu 290) TaxID=521674 RepID=D5SUL2_PLAL2|nr:Hsp20/alpha crystallin family protein [Planctopirus limnophila]ADG67064.1 heat shock protein Hsp20 [Planctopirus limnophila DSM 3776]